MQHPLDDRVKKHYDYANEYANQVGLEFAGTKLLKIPNGYYVSPAIHWKYLEKEFARNLPIKGHEEFSACLIKSWNDNHTQKISLSTKNPLDFHMISLMDRFTAHIVAVCSPWDNKTFISYPNCFVLRLAFLHQDTTMSIYCYAVKYQIIGVTKAALLANLPIQGIPKEECFWSFTPPYFISLNQTAVSYLEILICTDTGNIVSIRAIGECCCRIAF